jgi:hypothetical protein
MTSVYDSDRLAAAYAFDRPPVHEQIPRSARLARRVTGLEPIPAMLAHRRTVAPCARFVIGQAERIGDDVSVGRHG